MAGQMLPLVQVWVNQNHAICYRGRAANAVRANGLIVSAGDYSRCIPSALSADVIIKAPVKAEA